MGKRTDSRAILRRQPNYALFSFGLVCIIAAVVGGGVKALGAEIPVIDSPERQVLLGVLGLIVCVLSFVISDPSGEPSSQPAPVPIPERVSKYELDLDAAWRRVLGEAWGDQVPDILHLDDYKLAWNSWKLRLKETLDSDSYIPEPPIVMDVPKDGFVTRPITVLRPADRVVYEAVVDRMLEAIEAVLVDEVMSMRIDPTRSDRKRMQNQVQAWVSFQEQGRDMHVKGHLSYLISTDVTSYFQYVRLETLLQDLLSLAGVDEAHVNLLREILEFYESRPGIWGLPQGPTASSILGNFYLFPCDRVLALRSVRFLRFQDDFKILSSDVLELRRALQDLERALRERHLNLSVHKTKLLHGVDVLREFEDSEKDAISYGLAIGSVQAASDLHDLFDRAIAANPFNARDIRFSVVRLARLGDGYAVPWILDHLAEVPYLASHLVTYLSVLMESDPAIEPRVLDYLQNEEENIYPWTELHLIRLLSRASAVEESTHAGIWQVLKDERKHDVVRQHAARFIGRHARHGDQALLKNLAIYTAEVPLKRALVVAATESRGSDGPDQSWLRHLATSNAELAPTCDYLATVTRLPLP